MSQSADTVDANADVGYHTRKITLPVITPYGTGNATHTGNVICKRYVTGTSAAKAGLPYPQTYFTGIAPKYDVQYR